MKYDTILFDADGTLLDFLRSEKEAVYEALCEIGLEPDEEMLATYSRINDGLWKKLERREIEKKVLLYHRFELLFEQYGIDADARDMANRYMHTLSQKGYLLDGAEELCSKLLGKFRLYIVTNGVEFIQRGRYARCGIDRYFDGVFISDAIGAEKPSVEYFEYVAAHIPEFSKERTLIVGDSLTSDIRGGINYGIDTCWYDPAGKEAPEDMRDKITYIADSFDSVYSFIMQGEG